jgi:Cu(I)/Ag(I) efflux system membrane fusion protein
MDVVRRAPAGGAGYDPAELVRLGRVALNPAQRVLGNVATVLVEGRALTRSFRVPGKIVHDEEGLQVIAARSAGRVERLFVEETGTTVRKGEKLLSLYSPDLITAQEELLAAARGGQFSGRLRDEAARKLRLWGMTRGQIRRVQRDGKPLERVTVYAPGAGTVTMRSVQEGQYVREGQVLFSLSTLTRVWLEAAVYEKDVAFVEVGSALTFTTESFPGRVFSGEVEFVYPVIDEMTRTLRVRASFDNTDGDLRPGMYAVAKLSAPVSDEPGAVVPVSAVIRTGEADLVYVQMEEGLYERRKVTLGYRAEGRYQILSGVKVGDRVVSSGGFLVDSEAQLMAGLYGPASAPASAPSSEPASEAGADDESVAPTPSNGPSSASSSAPGSVPVSAPSSAPASAPAGDEP